MCGDPYCGSCGDPGAAAWERLLDSAYEKLPALEDVDPYLVSEIIRWAMDQGVRDYKDGMAQGVDG